MSEFAGGGWEGGNLARKILVLSPATTAEQLYSCAQKAGSKILSQSFYNHSYYLSI